MLSREVEVSAADPKRNYRYYVLGVLVAVYTLNFLDRSILGILASSIKKDFALTDSELGLMNGIAFAALYATMGIPIAWLADRSSRRTIVAAAVGLWSLFTALCGFTTGFGSLFMARVGVGVGEAGGIAPSYSMISDYFPKEQRARALSVYSLGIPIGAGCGISFGGLIAAHLDWRYAFIIVGGAGMLLAPLLRATVKDPPRGGHGAAEVKPARLAEVARIVGKKPTFWLLSLGAAAASIPGYGLVFWLPSFFMRTFHLDLVDTALFYGAITFVGGCIGILGGGMIADRLGGKTRAAYPLIPAVAFLVGLPCFFGAVHTSSLLVAFPLFLIPTALNLMWLGPIITSVQHLVPGHMRSTASAMFLLINNLLGIGIGSYFFGAMSDALRPHFGAESLHYAIYCGLGFYVISSTLFALGSRKIKRDWVD